MTESGRLPIGIGAATDSVKGGGIIIAHVGADIINGPASFAETHANAAFIVRAVNSHDELLGLVKYAQNHLDLPDEMQVEFLAAIAKAEGRA